MDMTSPYDPDTNIEAGSANLCIGKLLKELSRDSILASETE